VKKDIFHMLQLYERHMTKDHALRRACIHALNEVFFGPAADRTKASSVPAPSVLAPRLLAWYADWASRAGLFKSTMAAKHALQMGHVRHGCVSDPEDMQVHGACACLLILTHSILFWLCS
jgi:hypothetical protein